MLGKSLGYLGPTTLTVLPVEANQLSSWSDCEQGVDCLVHILAHEVGEVATM